MSTAKPNLIAASVRGHGEDISSKATEALHAHCQTEDVDTASRARNWTDARMPTLPESCEGLYMCDQHVNALH